eukprot:11310_1
MSSKPLNRIVFLTGLPAFSNSIHCLSSDNWFGNVGKIICMNVDDANHCVNIVFATESEAIQAIKVIISWNSQFQCDITAIRTNEFECKLLLIEHQNREYELLQKRFMSMQIDINNYKNKSINISKQIEQLHGKCIALDTTRQCQLVTIQQTQNMNMCLNKKISELENKNMALNSEREAAIIEDKLYTQTVNKTAQQQIKTICKLKKENRELQQQIKQLKTLKILKFP